MSPDGVCRTFDARANGFARGEGCGLVVLKPLDHALRDGDHIHGVICGSAVNQDGRSSGFTAPNVLSQVALIEAALRDAGLTPADIGVVEAHGTGTALGDPIEMDALVAALGRRNAGAPLHVGSVKTNLGHLEAAAGVAGLLKAIACCARRAIPPLVHYRTLNPRIDLSGTQIALPTSLVPWTPGDAGRFAGVSAFGLSGTNAHMIVGAADAARPESTAGAVAGFEIAARTPGALRELAARYRDRLAALPADRYPAFAYTATLGRARHAVRAQIAAADPAAARAALDAIARGAPSPAVTLAAREPFALDLPRSVVALPHYPWQREPHAPTGADCAPDARLAPLAPVAPIAPIAPLASFAPVAPIAPIAPIRIAEPREDVRGRVARVLGHRGASTVSDDASFFDLGLDSIMAVDLARELSAVFGIELALTTVFEHPSVAGLAAAIVARLSAAPAPPRKPRGAAAGERRVA